ncbi:amidophosphoribosyltransferase, partial [Candidatus Shapirobacteria bacterium CG_4_9_14_0_2_um_filter_40_11]
TTPQFERDKKARYENLKGAFVVNKDSSFMIQDSSFMIFDDIFASGATLNEAAKTLKQAGARQVWGLALAR